MMGVQAASAQLFYDFCLDDHVPTDHLLRGIDGHVDFEGLLFAIEALQLGCGVATGLLGAMNKEGLLVRDGLAIASVGLSESFGYWCGGAVTGGIEGVEPMA